MRKRTPLVFGAVTPLLACSIVACGDSGSAPPQGPSPSAMAPTPMPTADNTPPPAGGMPGDDLNNIPPGGAPPNDPMNDPDMGGSGGATAGSGGSDTAGSGGSDTDPPPNALGNCDLVCDDFEGTEFDLTKWDYLGKAENNEQMTPVLDASKANSGSQSVHIPGGLTRGTGFFPTMGLPTADNKFFVRAYLLFDTPTAQLMGHSAYIIAANAPDNGEEVRLGFSQPPGADSVMIDINIQNVADIGGEFSQFSNGFVTGFEPIPDPGIQLDAETWYCFEVLFNGQDHEVQLWIDGEEIESMHVTDWSPEGQESKLAKPDWSPTYNTVRFAPQSYSGSPGGVWFDDIAISTERVGCL